MKTIIKLYRPFSTEPLAETITTDLSLIDYYLKALNPFTHRVFVKWNDLEFDVHIDSFGDSADIEVNSLDGYNTYRSFYFKTSKQAADFIKEYISDTIEEHKRWGVAA